MNENNERIMLLYNYKSLESPWYSNQRKPERKRCL